MVQLLPLGPDAWITLAVVIGIVAALVGEVLRPDLTKLAGLAGAEAQRALNMQVLVVIAGALGRGQGVDSASLADAASASFLSPLGYQTNLRVMVPSGSRFTDGAHVGLSVTLLMMALTVAIISLVGL
ncbi:MAG: hypothetical protein ACLFTE_03320 [Salinivenus sp.]